MTLARADLERFPGTYVRESGSPATVDLLGDRLRFRFGQGPRFLLIPTSPTHFRVEGLPPGHELSFQVKDGQAIALTHRQPGRQLVLTRRP